MHAINVPEHILEACRKRRGRVHVFEEIDVATTALVVIDMQVSWLEPDFSVLEIPTARSIVGNINRLTATVRAAGGRVAWTQSTFEPDWTRSIYRHFATQEWIELAIAETDPGHRGFRISDSMDVQDGDIISVKNRPSALIQGASDLHDQLQGAGIGTLIITGTLTNACCESTARDAAALGYNVLFVSDGTATRSDAEHNATLANLMQLVADVRSTEDVCALIADSAGLR